MMNSNSEKWRVMGETIVCLVDASKTFGRFTLVEETSAPGSVVPPHLHNTTDEAIYVVAGRYEINVGGEAREAGPGEIVFIPRGTMHSFRNAGTDDAKLLAIISPSGFENFFREISALAAPAPDAETIAEIGRRHDLFLQ